jgi:acyl dehydratase
MSLFNRLLGALGPDRTLPERVAMFAAAASVGASFEPGLQPRKTIDQAIATGLISAVIGEQLPGHGTVYLGQSLKFMAPVRPGDSVYAEVKVTAIDHARRRVTLETHCAVGDTVVLKGEALVLAPSRKFD